MHEMNNTTHLIKFILAPLWVVDGRLVPVLEEVTGGNEPITACITRFSVTRDQANDIEEK